MALNADNVETACSILRQVIPTIQVGMHHFDEELPVRPGLVIGFSPKDDGGYECVFADVQFLSPAQEYLFVRLKGRVENSHFIREVSVA